MNKAYKFRAMPSAQQQELFAKTVGCARFVYNRLLADKIAHYKETGEMLHNTPAQYKDEFPFLREVDSIALCNAQLQVQAAYKNFFRAKSIGFPKFRSKKSSRKAYTTNQIKGNIAVVGNSLKLPKMGLVRVKFHRQIPDTHRIKSVTFSQDPSGKSTLDNGFGQFRTFLAYKLAEQGKQLVTIDKWFPSSKLCRHCGYVNDTLALSDRVWVCPSCGETILRDVNAAINIRDAGVAQIA